MRVVPILAGLAVAAGLSLTVSASAEVINLKAEAKAANEVPPGNSAATGALTATFDTATKRLSWKGSYTGLSGPLTGMHFHGPAGPAQNAGVVIPINPPSNAFEGSANLTDAQAADLLAGRWYLNIHTDANKGGEIRGQLVR